MTQTSSPPTAKKIRVLLADDHPLIVSGLEGALGAFGFDVVGSVNSVELLVEAYERLLPDVLVLDVQFEGKKTGLDVAQTLIAKQPNAKIVFYSQYADAELISTAYRYGCKSFVSKSSSITNLANSLTQVHHQVGHYIDADVAATIAKVALDGKPTPQNLLDERELSVFTQIALGLTNNEIAKLLNFSPKTISNVSQSIKGKLGIHRPADIARMAIKHGVIQV